MAAHEDVSREATFGSLPVTRDERVWNFADFTWVNVGLAIATWAFLVGGATALMVGFAEGMLAMLIGNAIGVALMLLASVVSSQRYGVEQYTVLRSVFGFGGVALIVFTIILFTEMGWSSLLSVMFGRAVSQVSNETLGASMDPNGLGVTAFALVAIVAAWAILAKGPLTIKWFNRIVAPGLAVLTVGMAALLFTETSWAELVRAAPLAPFEDDKLNFALAVEFNLGVGFSWWPVMGSLARLTTTPRAAMWPAFIGLFGATIVAQAVGMAAALTLGDSDPTVWMVPLGGAWLGALALVFVAFANLTSLASIVYSTCLALRQAGGSFLTRVPWPWLCAGFFVLPAVLAFFPGLLYDQFLLFVTWTGAFLAAICGTVVADYFWLRRQRIELRGLYSAGASSPYHFTGGLNVAALLSTGLGAVAYVLLYNPQTLETRSAFNLLTASVPAFVVAAVTHVLLTALIVRRAGQGGYDGDRLEIRPVTVADPGPGEVLVKLGASGVCGSDRHVLDGEWHLPSPTVMGHEGAGVVEAVGPGVQDVAVGDHVVLSWYYPCRRCRACAQGKAWACTGTRSNECLLPDGTTRLTGEDGAIVFPYLAVGTMSEYAVVAESAAVTIPEEVPFEVASLIGCSITTGVGAVVNNAQVPAGASAVVLGCGGVGLAVVMGLALVGAGPIIAVDTSDEKLGAARTFGATHTVRAGTEDVAARVRELTGGGADYAFEVIGRTETIEQIPGLLTTAGTGVLVGLPGEGQKAAIDVLELAESGKTLVGSNYGGAVPSIDFPRIARLYLDGRLPLDELISHRVRLDEVNEAFDAMRAGQRTRSVIVFD